MADKHLGAYNIADLRELAKQRLPRGLFEFMDRGCEDEVSLRNNRAVFERIKLKPRVLNDVSKRDQSITLFGQKQNMPIAIAPTGTPEWSRRIAAIRSRYSRIPFVTSSLRRCSYSAA